MDYYRVLTIAGSDSGAGAGIQADIKTISALGGYATSVITAVTAQNTCGIDSVFAIPPEVVRQQIKCVLDDIGADAVKIGMLCNKDIVNVVADELEHYNLHNVVVDPVLVSTSGRRLLSEEAVEVLKKRIFPLANLVTPNIPEAELLLPKAFLNIAEVSAYFYDNFKTSVYLKGGHMEGSACVDYAFEKGSITPISMTSPKLKTKNMHGTGCTLSSALACELAKGRSFEVACKNAHDYVFDALRCGMEYELGKGNGPLKHFHNKWW